MFTPEKSSKNTSMPKPETKQEAQIPVPLNPDSI